MTAAVILEFFRKLFTNKWFWIAVATIFAIFFINKYWNEIKRFFQRSDVDLEPGESKLISSDRKVELKAFAGELYQAIYATQNVGVSYREDKFAEAVDLSDNELRYVSKYYRKSLTKDNWLYDDIDDETMPFTSIDEELMARLTKVGEKG